MKRAEFLKTGLGLSLTSFLPFGLFSNNKKVGIRKNPVIKFTPENISKSNFGTYIIRHRSKSGYVTDVEANPNYAATVVWKLVWQLRSRGVTVVSKPGNPKEIAELHPYGLCNVLTDGWTHWVGSKEELCDYLNDNPCGEIYRVLTKEELFYILENRRNQKQLVREVWE